MKMDNFPRIKASLVIEGKKLDLKKLTEKLGILPTESRGISEWPKAIKNNLNLPEELQPRGVWCICQEMDSCKQIDIPVSKVIAQIEGKEQELSKICEQDCLKKSLCVTIHAQAMNLPEMILPFNIVSYLGKLEAEIVFDIYTY